MIFHPHQIDFAPSVKRAIQQVALDMLEGFTGDQAELEDVAEAMAGESAHAVVYVGNGRLRLVVSVTHRDGRRETLLAMTAPAGAWEWRESIAEKA